MQKPPPLRCSDPYEPAKPLPEAIHSHSHRLTLLFFANFSTDMPVAGTRTTNSG